MEQRQLSKRLQRRIGILVITMAGAVAITPLALALVLRDADDSARGVLLVVAGLLWFLAVVTHRALAKAHEDGRRGMLRTALAEARSARIAASEGFQDLLNEQFAMLDRIVDISETQLGEGIVDPSRTLDSIRLISSRAREAQNLVQDGLTEIGIESGSSKVSLEPIDLRTLIEDVSAPFIRGGNHLVISGPRHLAQTDPMVLRLLLRGLIESALRRQPNEVDISVVRNDSSMVCTVADDGLDRSGAAVSGLLPVTETLAFALGGELEYDRALGWNRYSLRLPEAGDHGTKATLPTPMDVLGARNTQEVPPVSNPRVLARREIKPDDAISFPPATERDPDRSVGALRRKSLTAR